MSLQIGDIVRARASIVAAFGIFFDIEGQSVLVLIPETSWVASFASCQELAEVGDEFDVKVLRDSGGGRISGSLKAVHPESDPWSGRWPLSVGAKLSATVR